MKTHTLISIWLIKLIILSHYFMYVNLSAVTCMATLQQDAIKLYM